jgi:hypothetical protein
MKAIEIVMSEKTPLCRAAKGARGAKEEDSGRTSLELDLSLDLEELELDKSIVLGQSSEASEDVESLGFSSLRHQELQYMNEQECKAAEGGRSVQVSSSPSRATEEASTNPRRVGHPHHSETKNQAGEELERERDSPGCLLLAVSGTSNIVGAVVDPEGEHDALAKGKKGMLAKSITSSDRKGREGADERR